MPGVPRGTFKETLEKEQPVAQYVWKKTGKKSRKKRGPGREGDESGAPKFKKI